MIVTLVEAGEVRPFLAVYSSPPATAPRLAIFGGSGSGILVYSATMAQSSSTEFVQWATMANTPNVLLSWEIVASYSLGSPVVNRGLLHVIHTRVW